MPIETKIYVTLSEDQGRVFRDKEKKGIEQEPIAVLGKGGEKYWRETYDIFSPVGERHACVWVDHFEGTETEIGWTSVTYNSWYGPDRQAEEIVSSVIGNSGEGYSIVMPTGPNSYRTIRVEKVNI